jgi:hypothetical protein
MLSLSMKRGPPLLVSEGWMSRTLTLWKMQGCTLEYSHKARQNLGSGARHLLCILPLPWKSFSNV